MKRLVRIVAVVATTGVVVVGTVAAVASKPAANAVTPSSTAALPTITASSASPAAETESDAPLHVDRCARTSTDIVIVDVSEQRLWTCVHGATVMTTAVTTGSDVHPTPTGHWRVYAKETDRWISGEGYSHQVDYWMPFHGGYGFHDSAWQRFPYGGDRRATSGSHGCVHVPAHAMKRLYRWADVGTRVRIVG